MSPARYRIAENIAAFRRARGWTQLDLCERLASVGVQMSKAGLSALECSPTSGRPASFPADLVAALAQALDVTPNDLYGWNDPPPVSYGAGYRDGRRDSLAQIAQLAADAAAEAHLGATPP